MRTNICAATKLAGRLKRRQSAGFFYAATGRTLLGAALFMFLAACAAPALPPAPVRPDSVYYLQKAQIQTMAFPAPPTAGSATDNEDLQVLRNWQAKRTAQQCSMARAEARGDYRGLFGSVSPFGMPSAPEVTDFFRRVLNDLDYAVGGIKDRYQRPRPFLRDAGLSPCIDRIGGYSYPSGHAANARVFALILSELAPDRREVFLTRADSVAQNRVIGGVHYPSDIVAGKLLGEAIYSELKKSSDFQNDVRSLQKYIRAP